jgi:hypothetical protein
MIDSPGLGWLNKHNSRKPSVTRLFFYPAPCSSALLAFTEFRARYPQGATAAELKLDEYFAIADSQSNLIPLFFNEDKQLVRAEPEFDEEKYVALYEQRKRKERPEEKGGRASTPK